MGSTTRREFTDEFKREAVALWETSGRQQTDVARELGSSPSCCDDGSGFCAERRRRHPRRSRLHPARA